MKKVFLVAFFAFLTIGQSLEPARDFLVAFLKESIHEEIQLHEQCLGTNFDESIKKILDSFEKENIPLIILEGLKIYNEIVQNCPIKSLQTVVDIIKTKLDDGSLLDKVVNKILASLKIITDEYNSGDYSGEALGTTAGKVVYEFIKETKFLQRFLHSSKSPAALEGINEVFYDLAKGFFDGLKRSNTKCQCFEDIYKLKDLFLERLDTCIKETQGGMNFYAAFERMIETLKKDLEVVYEPCRYYHFMIAIDKTWSQIVDEMIVYSFKIFPEFLQIIEGFKSNNAELVGKEFGKIVNIVLDFYVY